MSDKQIGFDPQWLSIIQFNLLSQNSNTPPNFDSMKIQSFETNSQIRIGTNVEKKLARVELLTEIKTVSKDNAQKEASANFHFSLIYKIENMDSLVQEDEKKIVILDSSLAGSFAAVSYSTTRGFLITHLKSTLFKDFILPVIDANKLLQNELPLEEK